MSVLYLHWDYQKSIQKSAVHFFQQEVKQKYYFCIETISIYIIMLANLLPFKCHDQKIWGNLVVASSIKTHLKTFWSYQFSRMCMYGMALFSLKKDTKEDRASHVTSSPIFIPSIRDRVLSTKNQSSKRQPGTLQHHGESCSKCSRVFGI